MREEGDPTLGLRGWLDIRRSDWPVEVKLGASLYTQRPDAEIGREYAATVRGSVSRWFDITPATSHRPTLRLFQRWQSLDEISAEHPERGDRPESFRTPRAWARPVRGIFRAPVTAS